jgi:hypothetical protein
MRTKRKPGDAVSDDSFVCITKAGMCDPSQLFLRCLLICNFERNRAPPQSNMPSERLCVRLQGRLRVTCLEGTMLFTSVHVLSP